MIVNEKLNLVIPLEREDGPVYVHSTPISKMVFERYFLVISKTFSEIYAGGLGAMSGPRVAAMLLRKIATDNGALDDVEKGLFAEIRRLTIFICPGLNGWEQTTLHDAIQRNLLDEDELSEVENALTFFIVASAMHRRKERKMILEGAATFWGGQVTLLDCMAWIASLTTSTETKPIPRTPSSIPV